MAQKGAKFLDEILGEKKYLKNSIKNLQKLVKVKAKMTQKLKKKKFP